MRRTRRITEQERQAAAQVGRLFHRHLARALAGSILLAVLAGSLARKDGFAAVVWITAGVLTALAAGRLIAWPVLRVILRSRREAATGGELSLEDVEVIDAISVGDQSAFCRLSDGRVMFFWCDAEDDPRGPTSRATLSFDAVRQDFRMVEWTGRPLQPTASMPAWDDEPEEGIALDHSWDSLLARALKPV